MKLLIKSTAIILLGTLGLRTSLANTNQLADVQSINNQQLAKLLNWKKSTSFCGGYYSQPYTVTVTSGINPLGKSKTYISQDKALFSEKNPSRLIGHVVITQRGRELKADKGYIYRNNKTGKLIKIHLVGNVHYQEKGHHLVAGQATLDFETNELMLDQVVYRLKNQHGQQTYNISGVATKALKSSDHIFKIWDGSYSVCPPTSNVWKLKASYIQLDTKSNIGHAHNARVSLLGIPIFYTPWLTFAMNGVRKSGFLFPQIGFSSSNGTEIQTPYYLNLAPNYDAIIAPQFISKRGTGVNTSFRYLGYESRSNFEADIMPNDRLFQQYKDTGAFKQYGNTPLTQPYLDQLNKDSNNRWLLHFDNQSTWNSNWQSSLLINRVSDSYYLQDFNQLNNGIFNDQLLSAAQLNYQSLHWQASLGAQYIQALHRLSAPQLLQPYNQLPKLAFNGDYPDQFKYLDYGINGSVTNFDQPKDFNTGKPVVSGTRSNLSPTISTPIENLSGYITPTLSVNLSQYNLHQTQEPNPNSISEAIPISSIDSGFKLFRDIDIGKNDYVQTLEPRLFYLYVPYKNQSDIPTFDTYEYGNSFDQLFYTNRFTSTDRIGDANQLSFGLTSRLLNGDDDTQKLVANIGMAYYFKNRRVCLNNDSCPAEYQQHVSPTMSSLTYSFDQHWNGNLQAAWLTQQKKIDNASVNLQYAKNNGHIISVGYNFIANADPIIHSTGLTQPENLSRINTGVSWQLTPHWSTVGNWQYNLSHQSKLAYFYGAAYNSCCWAMRIIASNTNLNNITGQAQDNTSYYLQIWLKGFTNFGSRNPSTLLNTNIVGYQDKFGE